jgi:hypothetical protein
MDVKAWIMGGSSPKTRRGSVPSYNSSVQEFLPIADIADGVVITKDGRYVKILEVLPVNFYLKSYTEQQNIIYYFASYLKIAPDNLQIRVLTQKADIGAYTQRMWGFYDSEENPDCQDMIADNVNMVHFLAHSEAVTRRFFLVFSLEPQMKVRGNEFRDIAARLRDEAETARRYLDFCGLEILQWDSPDDALITLFYEMLNKTTSKLARLDRPSETVGDFAFESEQITLEDTL